MLKPLSILAVLAPLLVVPTDATADWGEAWGTMQWGGANAETLIMDTEFEAADWSEAVLEVSGGAMSTVSQYLSGGNPGAYRRSELFVPGVASINVFHAFEDQTYTPAVEGPITTLDYTEDHIQLAPPFGGAVAGARVALRQGGTAYLGPVINFTITTWTNVTLLGLVETDFEDGMGGNPDFSTTGGEIAFGFARHNSSPSSESTWTIRTGIDNWSFTIHFDPDSDNDGLSNAAEALVGTDPNDYDSDDDGLSDGDEIARLADPLDPDSDDDGFCDGGLLVGGICAAGPDNCPLYSGSTDFTNSDAHPAGDVCQCGDVTNDGVVDATDLTRVREQLVGATLSGTFVSARCSVDGGAGDCDVVDAFKLMRYLGGESDAMGMVCTAYSD